MPGLDRGQGYTLALARRDVGRIDLSSGGPMAEILTESFCERCGTRYTFESAAPRKSRLGRVRTLSKGVRNFVLSDDASFAEAMAEARSEEELSATTHQLDAFHHTFNFCLTCRQYTCSDCWNALEGRCLTCAPLPGQEQPIALAALGTIEPEADALGLSDNGHGTEDAGGEAWPEMDLPPDRLARVLDLAPEPPEVAAAAAVGEIQPDLIDLMPAEAAFDAAELDAAAGLDVPGAGIAAAEPETMPEPHLIGVAPGQSLDEAIAQYEAQIEAQETAAAAEAEPLAGVEPDLGAAAAAAVLGAALAPEPDLELPPAGEVGEAIEPVVVAWEPEPEPVVAAEPEPEPVVAAEPEPEPVVAAEPEPPAVPGPVDRVEQPTWPVPPPVAPVPPAAPRPAPAPTPSPWLTVAPDDNTPPQWPVAPQWQAAQARREVPAALAGRPYLPQGDAAALWAASDREVLGAAPADLGAQASVQPQPCVSCGLSLSANARFCRRCGTRQG